MPEYLPQACVVPYRLSGSVIQLCLITSLRKHRWIFPKGIVDEGDSIAEAAAKESFEEAGLRGHVAAAPLGTYADRKWGRQLLVTVVLMEVTRTESSWPEDALRQRRWVTLDEACKLLAKNKLKRFAKAAVARISGSDSDCAGDVAGSTSE